FPREGTSIAYTATTLDVSTAVVRGRDEGRPLSIVCRCGVFAAEDDERGVVWPCHCQVQDYERHHEAGAGEHGVSVDVLQREVERQRDRYEEQVCQRRETKDRPPRRRVPGKILEPLLGFAWRSSPENVHRNDDDVRDA